MKPNNKLNQALKDALFEHPEPLHDGQWERLRVELEEKRNADSSHGSSCLPVYCYAPDSYTYI